MAELLSAQSLLSGRVKKTASTEVSEDRYNWLKLQEAEPDAGVPSVVNSFFSSDTSGNRKWLQPSAGLTVDQQGNVIVDELTLPIDSSELSFSNSATLYAVLEDLDNVLQSIEAIEQTFIQAVFTDNTITGNGTEADPLSIGQAVNTTDSVEFVDGVFTGTISGNVVGNVDLATVSTADLIFTSSTTVSTVLSDLDSVLLNLETLAVTRITETDDTIQGFGTLDSLLSIGQAVTPTSDVQFANGTFTGIISGNGSLITDIDAAAITTGIISEAVLPPGTFSDTNFYLDGLTFDTATGILTASVFGTDNQTVDLDGRYLLSTAQAVDSNQLNGQLAAYYLDWDNTTRKPSPVLTITGDAAGTATFVDLESAALVLTVADDSHNHTVLTSVASVQYTGGVSSTADTVTTTSTVITELASFDATVYSAAEATVVARSAAGRHITKLLIVHDGTTAWATEYGIVYSSQSLFDVDVDINAGRVRVMVIAGSTAATVFRTKLSEFVI